MKKSLALIALATLSMSAFADMFAVFREEDGSTKWQYVANTSASVLILTLVIVLLFLIRAHLRSMRSNRALTEIKATLGGSCRTPYCGIAGDYRSIAGA